LDDFEILGMLGEGFLG